MEGITSRRQFVDDDSRLLQLHHAWIRKLVASLHTRSIVPERPAADVRDSYRAAAAELPELREELDFAEDRPALADQLRSEYSMLARIAGLAPDGTDSELAAERGRALVMEYIPEQRLAVS